MRRLKFLLTAALAAGSGCRNGCAEDIESVGGADAM